MMTAVVRVVCGPPYTLYDGRNTDCTMGAEQQAKNKKQLVLSAFTIQGKPIKAKEKHTKYSRLSLLSLYHLR